MEERNLPSRILIIGQSGSGKSSLVNILVGKSVAAVNDSATCCSTQFTSYPVNYNNVSYELIDTCDWRKPLQGSSKRENHWERFSKDTGNGDRGFSCVIFVMKKGRIESEFQQMYDFIYKQVLKEQAPALLYVANCEQDIPMNTWSNAEINISVIKKSYKFRDIICGTGGCGGNFESELPSLREQTRKSMWLAIENYKVNKIEKTQTESHSTKETIFCHSEKPIRQIMSTENSRLIIDKNEKTQQMQVLESKTMKELSYRDSHINNLHRTSLGYMSATMPVRSKGKERSKQTQQCQTAERSNVTPWSINESSDEALEETHEETRENKDFLSKSEEIFSMLPKHHFNNRENNLSENRNNLNHHSNAFKSRNTSDYVSKVSAKSSMTWQNTGERWAHLPVQKMTDCPIFKSSASETVKKDANGSSPTMKSEELRPAKASIFKSVPQTLSLIQSKQLISNVGPVTIMSHSESTAESNDARSQKDLQVQSPYLSRPPSKRFPHSLLPSKKKTSVRSINSRARSSSVLSTAFRRKPTKVFVSSETSEVLQQSRADNSAGLQSIDRMSLK